MGRDLRGPRGGAGADGATQLDDAGCPLSTGPLSSLADAGFPTTGLTLWLRADRGLATADAGAVCRWDDQSGNGYTFRPTLTPPSLVAAGIEGHPAISFVGNEELSRGDVLGLGATSARTIAVYGKATDLTNRFHYFIQGEVGSPGVYVSLDQNTFQTAGSLEGVYVGNNAFDSNVPTASAPRSQIFSMSSLVTGTSLPGALVYEVDGTVVPLNRTAGSGAVESLATMNFTSIGALGVGGEAWGGALLGEVIVWNRALTDAARADVETHFQAHFQ